jgi:hypothetical protein
LRFVVSDGGQQLTHGIVLSAPINSPAGLIGVEDGDEREEQLGHA